jgi:hypothetical protein
MLAPRIAERMKRDLIGVVKYRVLSQNNTMNFLEVAYTFSLYSGFSFGFVFCFVLFDVVSRHGILPIRLVFCTGGERSKPFVMATTWLSTI